MADIRRTRLLGVTHAPAEGGVMMVRSRDDIYRMADLKGKKIGLSRSQNTIKTDWWGIQEEQGIELMLRLNGMTRKDVHIVEFPYPDDWYDKPEMMGPEMENPSELWLRRDHKHDLAFRPLETALEKGIIDAMYMQTGPLSQLSEETGKFKSIEDLARYPDWTLQVANIPAAITCTDVMAEQHPELVVTFMKGMIKVGRWANEHKRAAAAILDKQTFYRDVAATYEGIKPIDMVPNLSPKNLVSVEIGKDFMLSHGYIKNDFDVQKWAAPEFLEQAAKELLELEWKKTTMASCRRRPSCSARRGSARTMGKPMIRWMAIAFGGVLLSLVAVPARAQEPPPTTEPADVANEYRITAFPSYRINEQWSGFGYLGWVNKPDADYTSYYLGKGVNYAPAKWVQIWGGLIGVYTNSGVKSDSLELRPFIGPKFLGSNQRKWRYYNWTRYEARFTETLDTDEWKTVHRVRNQTRLEVPLASASRAWTPKSWYALGDVEPIYRSDTGTVDPLRIRLGLGRVVNARVLMEFQYFVQYTRPDDAGLAYTDNIFRLNFKIGLSRGLSVLKLLDGGIDD